MAGFWDFVGTVVRAVDAVDSFFGGNVKVKAGSSATTADDNSVISLLTKPTSIIQTPPPMFGSLNIKIDPATQTFNLLQTEADKRFFDLFRRTQ